MSVDVDREKHTHTYMLTGGRETLAHPLLFYRISTWPVTAEHRFVHPGCSRRDATQRFKAHLSSPPSDEIDSGYEMTTCFSLLLSFCSSPFFFPLQRHADSPVAPVFLLDHSVALEHVPLKSRSVWSKTYQPNNQPTNRDE